MCDFSESPDTESEAAVNHIDLNALQKRRARRWETRGWRCPGLRAGPGSPPQPLGEKQRCPSSALVLQLCSASLHGRAVASHRCPHRALVDRPSTARCCAKLPFWVSSPSQQLPGSAAGQKAVQDAALALGKGCVCFGPLCPWASAFAAGSRCSPWRQTRHGAGHPSHVPPRLPPGPHKNPGSGSGGRSHSCREARRRAAACPKIRSCCSPGCSWWRLGAGCRDLQQGARCGLTEQQKLGAAQSFLPRSPGVSVSTSNHQDGFRRQRLVF